MRPRFSQVTLNNDTGIEPTDISFPYQVSLIITRIEMWLGRINEPGALDFLESEVLTLEMKLIAYWGKESKISSGYEITNSGYKITLNKIKEIQPRTWEELVPDEKQRWQRRFDREDLMEAELYRVRKLRALKKWGGLQLLLNSMGLQFSAQSAYDV